MVCFYTPISLLKLYVSVRGVDMYTVPSLNNLCRVSEFRAAYTCLLTLSDLLINSISSHF